MEGWDLVFGVVIGVALATLMAQSGREEVWRRQADEIRDAARFGWMRVNGPHGGGGANENRS
ncbi:YtxH domain-containing protein [Microbacterium trichothecenolyticum]|uniref:Uncharacterized protein n=1 Tax=Microbacterium trichothecenolyticum TaxID=69370 RepID=A0ABU0TU27_MICTR|nr:YtxH domain-containing protein [Microbacterium trichothecenolyticum]MDQ1123170.1 hypothetical protein [Microbacterium trichothecenolyticum]